VRPSVTLLGRVESLNSLGQAPTIWDADTNGHKRTKTETDSSLCHGSDEPNIVLKF